MTPSKHPDQELVDAVLAGDDDAFRRLVERESRTVIAICRRVLRDPDEAEDAAQDAFIQAYRSLPTYRGDGPFGAWVRRIAIRMAYGRVAARRDAALPEPDLEGGWDPAGTAADEPETRSLLRERRRELVALIADLPDAHRRVVALRFQGELSIEEIALATGSPTGTVKSRLHRALGTLRERLEARPAP